MFNLDKTVLKHPLNAPIGWTLGGMNADIVWALRADLGGIDYVAGDAWGFSQ